MGEEEKLVKNVMSDQMKNDRSHKDKNGGSYLEKSDCLRGSSTELPVGPAL